jgi:hypothetical protein
MKKILSFFLVACIAGSLLVAEMNEPHRDGEVGMTADVVFANNWLTIGDFFPDDGVLKVDLNQMYKDMLDGIHFDSLLDQKLFLNINARKAFRLGFTEHAYGSFGTNISRGILDMLANGNPNGKIEGSGSLYGSLYTEISLSLMTFIKDLAGNEGKDLGIKITPAIFVPIFVVDPSSSVEYSVNNASDGSMSVNAKAKVLAYSLIDFGNADQFAPESIFSSAGYDVSLYAEYPALSKLDVAVDLRHIPLYGARAPYEVDFSTDVNMSMDSMLSGDGTFPEIENPFENMDTVEFKKSSKRIYRQFELGLAAAWRPFSWLALHPSFSFVFDTPFYVEYGAGVELHWSKWVSATLSTNYEDRLFAQRLNLMFNMRVLELEFMLQTCSSDFIKSFQGAGLGAGIGIKLGF